VVVSILKIISLLFAPIRVLFINFLVLAHLNKMVLRNVSIAILLIFLSPLISHSSLPLTYWPYAFSTSVYLINRLPSSTRGFKSPWEVLFHHTPTYTLFKSFGCACFPLLRPYSKHKLLPRSSECVFLGYASNSKGIFVLILIPLVSMYLGMLFLMRLLFLFVISLLHPLLIQRKLLLQTFG
jgi:hypothetical protein